MSNLFVLPRQVPLTSAGKVYPGAKAYFYRTGTTTPKNTYADAAFVSANTNPVIADGGGAFGPIFLDTSAGEYRLTLRTSADVLIYTQDNVGTGVQPYPVIEEETDALVTVVDYNWPPGWVPRYGALGDGSDETALVQAALNVGMQGVPVYFPKNKQYMVTQMDIKWGMSIYGFGPNSDGTCSLLLAPNQPRFQRIFTTEDNLWDDDEDSPPLLIDGLSFDGNFLNQGTYTGFEKEHQQHIGLFAQLTKAGRLIATVRNCYHQNSCSDGTLTFYNTDVTIDNCKYKDCFRSSVAMTGGNALLRISNCSASPGTLHDSRFQIEVDTAGFGGFKNSDLVMSNCTWQGGLDLALSGPSTLYLENVIFLGEGQCIVNLDGDDSRRPVSLRMVNCFMRVADNNSNTHRFLKYNDTVLTNCVIEYTNAITHTDFLQQGGATNQSITFQNCRFRGDSSYHTTATVAVGTSTWASGLLTVNTSAVHGLAVNDYVDLESFTTGGINGVYRVATVTDTDTFAVAFPRDPGAVTVGSGTSRKRTGLNAMSMSADTSSNLNQVNMFGCHFEDTVDCGFDMHQGGWLCMDRCHMNGGILFDAGAAASFLFDIRIGQYTPGGKNMQMCHVTGSVAGCVLRFERTYVTVEKSGFTRSGNLTGLSMFGERRIYGSGAVLTTDPGFINDRYVRNNPVAATAVKWCCTVAGQSGASTTWVQESALS